VRRDGFPSKVRMKPMNGAIGGMPACVAIPNRLARPSGPGEKAGRKRVVGPIRRHPLTLWYLDTSEHRQVDDWFLMKPASRH
jgi:hypothetical protein